MLFAGCAYYNTFYNARESYEEALEFARENPDDPASHEKDLLDTAVEGAGRVLARYPESRWVDDAQLLLGDALLLRGKRTLVGSGTSDFQQAMMSFSSVLVMTESRDFKDRARLGLGRAAMELERFNDAAAALQQVSADDRRRHAMSRLLLCEAYLGAAEPEMAAAIMDSLHPAGGDSLEAEYYITGGRILAALGMPDSGAVVCLKALERVDRGEVYYRALVSSAECWIQAGQPDRASFELSRLLQGYRSDREMADISLLKGRADEMAGDTAAALTAYLDAAELDTYRETGAEALYRRAVLLEHAERFDEALETLADCYSRPGDFMWLRISENRHRDLELYRSYSDSAQVTSGEMALKLRLLAAEKRLDLYGPDRQTLEEFREIADENHLLFSAMAQVLLAENGGIPEDSVYNTLLSVAGNIPASDLAGHIEETLGLSPHPLHNTRPSAVLEEAWALLEEKKWEEGWLALNDLLNSPFSYEVRAEALWAAYVAAESARMDGGTVDSYLEELTEHYPDTPQGAEAALRRAQGLEEEEPEEE